MHIVPASKILRTDMFKTMERPETTGVFVAYTRTIADPRIDAAFFDTIHCQRGYFGGLWHYVVRLDGTVEIGRGPRTISSYSSDSFYAETQIYIGIVGGRDFDTGDFKQTVTPEQDAAVEELIQAIANALNVELEVVSRVDLAADAEAERHEAETAAWNEAMDRAEALEVRE